MNTTQNGIEVKVGQRWRDNDKRMKGRIVTIVSVSAGRAYYDRGQGRKPGRLTISRMHNKSTGFTLLP